MLKKLLKKLSFLKKTDEENQLKKDKLADKSNTEKKKQNKSNTPDDIYPLW